LATVTGVAGLSGSLSAPSERRFQTAAVPGKLPPNRPQVFVDKVWTKIHVGGLQRQEIQQRRGFQPGSCGYNEVPTSSCHTFCWKARQSFDVPFFYPRQALRAFASLRDMSLR
jgi:hypothetical protein